MNCLETNGEKNLSKELDTIFKEIETIEQKTS